MAPIAVVCATVVDCQDPVRLAGFWRHLLGGRIVSYPQFGVESLRAPGITFDFVRNPDAKVVKNRWHLDLATDDPQATVTEALAAGATRAVDFEDSEDFVVMRDPEGNEFCVLRHAPATAPWDPPPLAEP
jgi:hypothetical protein